MYNRYIPQSDGTYRRNQMNDGAKEEKQETPSASVSYNERSRPSPSNIEDRPRATRLPSSHQTVASFLKSILPKNFDSGDLIVVLLLLLMSGDCQEDQNSALLTLVLYLFM